MTSKFLNFALKFNLNNLKAKLNGPWTPNLKAWRYINFKVVVEIQRLNQEMNFDEPNRTIINIKVNDERQKWTVF